MEECSPDVKYNGFSCFDNATIGKLFNTIANNKALDSSDANCDNSDTFPDVVARRQIDALRKQTECDTDYCIAKALKKEHEVSRFLKPEKTKKWADERAWLSNLDIDDVLRSYTGVYPTFHHAGTFPIDFQEPEGVFKTCTSDMCDFDKLGDLLKKNNVKFVSFVFNTHKRSQSGEHWFCAFFDIPSKKLYFNDSVGNETRYSCRYMTRFQELLAKRFGPFEMIGNTVQKQPYGSGECGLYCLFFITKMLEMATYCNVCRESPEKQWYNPKTGTCSYQKKSDTDVFCGRPEDFFMSETCMSDMKRYNAHMEQQRYEFFNVRDADGRRIRKEGHLAYNDCAIGSSHNLTQQTDKNRVFVPKVPPTLDTWPHARGNAAPAAGGRPPASRGPGHARVFR
jgi:hypothetical protein